MRYLLAFLLLFNTAYAADATGQDYVVATIGDQNIYYSEILKSAAGLNKFLKENFDTIRDWRLNFIRQYVARTALAMRAEQEGLDKDKSVQFDIEQAKKTILSDRLLFQQLEKVQITEENLKSFYEQNKKDYQERERAKFSYIKVDNKEEANKITQGLNKGKAFEKLGGKNLVKLDNWNTKGAPFMPELKGATIEQIDGLFALGTGGASQPIAANGRFYIFKVDEKEAAKDVDFEKARPQVEIDYKRVIQGKTIDDYIKDTFAKEKVVVNEGQVK